MISDVIVVGAGVAGLACARALTQAGKSVRVLERSRGVGGRCATRRVEGQAVDHGVAFLHGRSARFLELLRAVPGERLDGWPAVVRGTGGACQPRAFTPGESRVAFAAGVNALPKQLARSLELLRDTEVTALVPSGATITVHARTREQALSLRSRDVVLALAAPQALALLAGMAASTERDAACALLRMLPSVPCATVIAVYPRAIAAPPWQMWYPEDSEMLQLISHDSSKRDEPAQLVLVMQARPAWSRAQLAAGTGEWPASMLQEAARLAGPELGRPQSVQTQLWQHARATADSELTEPLLLALPQGPRIGLAGEIFAAGGGVEAAWSSGNRLAERMIRGESR